MKKLRLLFALTIAALWLCCLPAAAEPTDTTTLTATSTTTAATPIEKIDLVTAEDVIPKNVYYYSDNTQYTSKNYRPDRGVFARADGRAIGSALNLNGNKQYLRLPSATVNKLESFTFSTRIKWKGNLAAEGTDNQKLLTFFANEYFYFSVSLHASDAEKSLNGPCLNFATLETDATAIFTQTDEGTTFAFPKNEWHHIAVTLSETSFTLYIDGVKQLDAAIQIDFDQMPTRKLHIGAGIDTESTLNALLEGASLYTSALSEEQIFLLSRDLDPLSDTPLTTTTDILATRPPTSATTVKHTETFSGRIMGLPLGLVIVLGALILIIVILSIIFSIRGNQSVRTEDEEDELL